MSSNEAIRFWAKAYRSGVRITMGADGVEFTQSWHYWQRLTTFGRFGCFPDAVPVRPVAWIETGVSEHISGLQAFLETKIPARYMPFAFHLLVLDYELKPIEHDAHKRKVGLRGIGADGGWVLSMVDYCPSDDQLVAPPPISNILSQYGAISI